MPTLTPFQPGHLPVPSAADRGCLALTNKDISTVSSTSNQNIPEPSDIRGAFRLDHPFQVNPYISFGSSGADRWASVDLEFGRLIIDIPDVL